MSAAQRLRDSGLALAIFAVLIAVTAIPVALLDAPATRRTLALGFAHPPRTWQQALAIYTNNLRVLALPLVMAGVSQARFVLTRPISRRIYLTFCDAGNLTALVHHMTIVGILVGAYGTRMLGAIALPATFEFSAYAIAAAVYLHARRTHLRRSEIAAALHLAAIASLVLLIGALVEAFL